MAFKTPDIKLYDTYSRKKQLFTPLDASNVRLYACGPTVYDYAHIGNGRMAIVFDLLYRLLLQVYGEENVTYVRNITDIDDKINARAASEYPRLPLNEAIRKVTGPTHDQYQKDVTGLGCLAPNHQPRATETVPEMVAMIEKLIEKENAYAAEGHVLFDVKSWKDGGENQYGKLSRRSLDDMIAGARVEVAPYKRDPMDFVLWKPSTDEEPGWDSPWGRGRPGWHIECSAMSAKYLGDVFDIHGGGIDLSFPHHENELAQSCCANGTDRMAQIWMHNGFLQVEGRKMSKSDGNFITIADLLETEKFGGRKWPGDVLRLAMLMTHYREPIDFSLRKLEEAVAILDRWERQAATTEQSRADPEFLALLADDLGTPQALSRVHELMADPSTAGAGLGALDVLGINPVRTQLDDTDTEAKVASRLKALNNKDFSTADKIRADLLEQGVQLMDFKDAETGERRTKWEIKR